MSKFGYLTIIFLLYWSHVSANNAQVFDVQLVDENTLSFSLSWENSWLLDAQSSPYNYDALWVFAKIQYQGGDWAHLSMPITADQYDWMSVDLEVETVEDTKGFFVKKSSSGVSEEVSMDISITLPTPILIEEELAIRVYGIEMVYVPEAPYWLGDGDSYYTLGDGGDLSPFFIESESSITVGPNAGQLYADIESFPADDIPAAYPKGYASFYSMKYEISQEQYKDFLNTLTENQQMNRTAVSPYSPTGTQAMGIEARNGIIVATPSQAGWTAQYACDANDNLLYDQANDGQSRACNFLNWADVTAYLDWAALRPLTELEFEKMARGSNVPIVREFAWGTDSVTVVENILLDGTDEEYSEIQAIDNAGLANYQYNAIGGPLRSGFAADATSDRLQSGASYYGLMELSGNLWEVVVNVDSVGLNYDAQLGDGFLDDTGHANVANWPQADAKGAGLRGGAWNSGDFSDFRDAAVSDRYYAFFENVVRRSTGGGRGGR